MIFHLLLLIYHSLFSLYKILTLSITLHTSTFQTIRYFAQPEFAKKNCVMHFNAISKKGLSNRFDFFRVDTADWLLAIVVEKKQMRSSVNRSRRISCNIQFQQVSFVKHKKVIRFTYQLKCRKRWAEISPRYGNEDEKVTDILASLDLVLVSCVASSRKFSLWIF